MNRLKPRQIARLKQALMAGYSVRMAASLAGCAKNTASLYARVVDRAACCPCGNKPGHRGWCWWRVALSPARQRVLQLWKDKRSRGPGWIVWNGQMYPPKIAQQIGRQNIQAHQQRRLERTKQWQEHKALNEARNTLWRMRYLLEHPEALQSLRKESLPDETSRSS